MYENLLIGIIDFRWWIPCIMIESPLNYIPPLLTALSVSTFIAQKTLPILRFMKISVFTVSLTIPTEFPKFIYLVFSQESISLSDSTLWTKLSAKWTENKQYTMNKILDLVHGVESSVIAAKGEMNKTLLKDLHLWKRWSPVTLHVYLLTSKY